MYGGTIGVLRKNIWGGKSAGYYYITGLMDLLSVEVRVNYQPGRSGRS